jgi:hypothetical protein
VILENGLNALLRARLDASGRNCEGTRVQNLEARIDGATAGDSVPTAEILALKRVGPFAAADLVGVCCRSLRIFWSQEKRGLTLRWVRDDAFCKSWL